jgi:hypothetical protein
MGWVAMRLRDGMEGGGEQRAGDMGHPPLGECLSRSPLALRGPAGRWRQGDERHRRCPYIIRTYRLNVSGKMEIFWGGWERGRGRFRCWAMERRDKILDGTSGEREQGGERVCAGKMVCVLFLRPMASWGKACMGSGGMIDGDFMEAIWRLGRNFQIVDGSGGGEAARKVGCPPVRLTASAERAAC